MFRTGAVWLFLLGVAHSISLFEKPVAANDTETQLIALTTDYKFNLMGSMRRFDTLFRGFSISFVLEVFVMGLSLFGSLQRACAIAEENRRNQRIVAGRDNGGFAALFFPAPTAFLVVALLLFMGSWLSL